MTTERIQSTFTYPAKYVEVDKANMHYVEVGEGKPILFLHGVPTSCYVWRNILPHIAPLGRCIALDLIGFGKSDKPKIAYTIADHIKYVEKFIEILNLQSVTIVMHGLGSVIGFDYAMRNEKNCQGLVFYEAFLAGGDEQISLPYQEQLLHLRNEVNHAEKKPVDTTLVDELLQQSIMRRLNQEELLNYRKPFVDAASMTPILTYLKELPTSDDKGPIEDIVRRYSTKLTKSTLPKLMMYSVPGFIATMSTLIWAKENLPNLEVVDLGEEMHLAQESYPDLIGETISVWLQGVEQGEM